MSASTNDKVTDTRNAARPVSTTVSSGRSTGGATLACVSLTGWPTASKVHFVTYQIDSNSNPIAGTQLDCYGIVSGTSITSFTVIDGTDTGNSIGDVVEMLPTSAWGQDLADALMHQHSRIGAHVGITNTSGMTNAGGLTNTGGLSTDTLTVSSTATITGAATLSGGTTLPAGDIGTDDIATSAVTPIKMLGIDMYGVTGAITGSAPAAGTGQFYIQAGTTVGTFASNSLSISFPTAFPGGVLTVIVSDGDQALGNPMSLTASNITTSGFRAQSAVATGQQRVNWISIGF